MQPDAMKPGSLRSGKALRDARMAAAIQQFHKALLGRHSRSFPKYELESAATSPKRTPVTIPPPTGPRRRPPAKASASRST